MKVSSFDRSVKANFDIECFLPVSSRIEKGQGDEPLPFVFWWTEF
jgi:hypothetical protein